MIEINASGATIIQIGYAGENESRAIRFNYPQEWIDEFPNGEIEIHVKRAGDGAVYQAQEVEEERSSRTVIWTITSTETSYSGRGEAQLCWVDNGVVVKSQRYTTNVEMSTAAVTPTDPPPDTIIEQAVEDYLRDYVDVITVNDHGEDGQILQSNGDGSYSWLSVDNQVIDSDTGDTLVPTRELNRLARAIRQKTGYEGDMTVETMAEVMEQTQMWTTEDYCLGIAPAGEEITLTMGSVPAYALYQRQNIAKVNLPYAGIINAQAFRASSIAAIAAPNVTRILGSCFYDCTALVDVVLPNVISLTGDDTFHNCTALTTVILPNARQISGHIFHGCTYLERVSLPRVESSSSNFISAFNSCTYLEVVDMPNYTGSIHTQCFMGCSHLTSLRLPKMTGIVSSSAFQGCTSLSDVYFPSCMTWANNNFAGCTSLKRLCLYVKPTTLGATALNGPALEDIYVPWSQGEVSGAPWGAPAGCTVHYDTTYDEDGEPIV